MLGVLGRMQKIHVLVLYDRMRKVNGAPSMSWTLFSLSPLLFLLSWVAASWWFSLPLMTRPQKQHSQADKLNLWLQEWQLLSSRGMGLNTLSEIPDYKFFSRLALAGLRHARTYGKFPRELLWEWREGLNRESSFDKKQRELLMGSLFQFALFSVIIWLFILMTGQQFIALSPRVLCLILFLHMAGFLSFSPLIIYFRNRTLKGLPEMLETLYVLKSLSQAGLSVTHVMQEAKLERLPQQLPLEQQNLAHKLRDLIKIYQSQGAAVALEAKILVEEAWFLRTHLMQKLTTRLEAYKLLWLIVFFGSSYAIFIVNLIGELLRAS